MITFSTTELEGIGKVQDHLLSPPMGDDGTDEWRDAVNYALMEAIGADFALFQLPVGGVSLLRASGLDQDRVRLFRSHLGELDDRVDYSERMARFGVGIRSTLWSGRMQWFYRSVYYNEIIRPARAFDPVWAAVPVPDSRRPAVIHAYHGDRAGRRFGERGLAMMRLLRPALEAAVNALGRFRACREGLFRAFDTLAEGVFLVDRRCRILYRNRAAADLWDGEPADGILADRVTRAAESVFRPFHEVVEGLAPVVARARTRRGTVDIRACRLEEEELGCSEVALVTVRLRGVEVPDRRDLRGRLGLTPRQAEVAQLLARRATNAEVARALGISPHTAERHTEKVMSKLGVHSRRQVRHRIRRPLPDEKGLPAD